MARTKAEIGSSGVPIYSGRVALDSNSRLRWPQAGRIYRTMMDDEIAVGALRGAVHTLLRTELQVTPGGDTDADKRAAEHVEHCLRDMRIPIGTAIRQLASAYFYGFDVHELVYTRRPDGTIGWATWGLRRQETLERWDTKDNQVTAFVQRAAPDFKLTTIPLRKAIHFVADDSDGSPEGRGILRSMYRYWYMIVQFELLFGISLERFGTGLSVFQMREGVTTVLTEGQLTDLGGQAENLRQNEQAYLLLPPGLEHHFAPSPGLDANTYLQAIQYYRAAMLMTGLSEFLALGTGSTGGAYALGDAKIELFLKSLTGLQENICETITRQAIPRLMRLNGWGDVAMPTVSLPAVRQYDLASLGQFASMLKSIGAFHATPQDEEWFRRISDLADIDMDTLEDLHEQGKQQAAADTRATQSAEAAMIEEVDAETEDPTAVEDGPTEDA